MTESIVKSEDVASIGATSSSNAKMLVQPAMELDRLTKTNAEIQVSSIPKIQVDAGVDWGVILGATVTIATLLVTTFFTIRTYKLSLKSQEDVATQTRSQDRETTKAQILSGYRQDWINTLRDTTAEFVTSVMTISDLYALRAGTFQQNAQTELNEEALEWNYRLHEAKSSASVLKYKLLLLANPTEPDFKTYLRIVDALYEHAVDGDQNLTPTANSLIGTAQTILKTEWDRVKTLEGLAAPKQSTPTEIAETKP